MFVPGSQDWSIRFTWSQENRVDVSILFDTRDHSCTWNARKKIFEWYTLEVHKKLQDRSRRWKILDIFLAFQVHEWSLVSKRMDTSTLFSWLQVNLILQSWEPGTNIYKSHSRDQATSNWWNSDLQNHQMENPTTSTPALANAVQPMEILHPLDWILKLPKNLIWL